MFEDPHSTNCGDRPISQFPSLGIPRLELENPHWNTYVGHWNSNVGIIPTWFFQLQPRNFEAREPTTVVTE